MTPWKPHHYARAEEFVRLVASALAQSGGSSTPFAPPPPSASVPPFPVPAPVAAPAKPVTAAAMFKSIPWKK